MSLDFPRPSSLSTRDIVLGVWMVLALNVLAMYLDWPYVRQFLSLLSLFVIPGVLIILLCDIDCGDVWEYAALTLGLSIAFLMGIGLLLNQLFRALRLPQPLDTATILTVFIVCFLAGSTLALMFKTKTLAAPPALGFSILDWYLLLGATLFPILSTYGAISLNSGGNNMFSVGTILLICTYVAAIAWLRDRVSPHTLAYAAVMIGLAMLLSFSLRSWHISGWDINQEFFVYQLTDANRAWMIEVFRDPYNACLSISILPVIANIFLGINDEYVFKLVYQLLFAAVPLVVFLIARRYVSSFLSLLASLFFVFQPWFIQPMPALARQQIALLFFALLLLVLFDHKRSGWRRNMLLVVFGTALIVSHYSTAYVGLGMLTLTLLAANLLKLLVRPNRFMWRTTLVPGWVLLVFYAMTFYWTNILTQTSGNVTYVVQLTLQNMRSALLSDLRSEDILLTLGAAGERFTLEDVNDYVRFQTEQFAGHPDLYPAETSRGFTPQVVRSVELTGVVGEGPVRVILAGALLAVRQLTKLLLVVGALILMRHVSKSRGFDFEYALLNLMSLAILFLFIILPVLSLYYNLFRIYVQLLVISSVSLVVGANYVVSFIPQPLIRMRLITLLIVSFFIASNGLASYIVGGPATMNLNNAGEDFDKFYTHEYEVEAARWLSLNRDPHSTIYADGTAELRLISFAEILNSETAILPSTITRDSYVYLDYANLTVGIVEAQLGGKQLSHNFPLDFLDQNKDRLYDNGGAQIYK